MGLVEIVPIRPFSDGDPSHVPKAEWSLVNPPTIYLEKIGTSWVEKQTLLKPGASYYLDQLPYGYRLYERPRPGNTKIVDKHLYGHPKHKFFDSPNRFWPHFEHLMNHGTNDGCSCTICGAKGTVPLPIGSALGKSVKQVERPPQLHIPQAVDEETVPDTIRELLNRLKREGTLDLPIEERFSMDWRAEKDVIAHSLERSVNQKSWFPRIGEIVLFLRSLPQGSEVCLDNSSQEFKIWTELGRFGSHPQWEAGVIGQVPEEAVKLQDAIQETEKSQAIALSGYRVEPLPNPNSDDKSLSLQYKYVPLHCIRPFVFWKEYLKGMPESQLHPSIANALTIMSTLAMVNRTRVKGTWPSATIYCQGAYMGSELICVGDTVRLLPSKSNEVQDILQVETIKLVLSNLDKASTNDYDEGHPYNCRLYVVGKCFTTNVASAWKVNDVAQAAKPNIEGYDEWYHSHDPSKQLQVTFTRIMGRCFEAEPMLLWFPSIDTAFEDVDTRKLLSYGSSGLQYARLYSAEHDRRILPGKSWFWADSRAEALDIPSLNNIDISYWDEARDEEQLEQWSKATKIMERTASAADKIALREKVLEQNLAGARVGLDTGRSALRRTLRGQSSTPVIDDLTLTANGDNLDDDDDDDDAAAEVIERDGKLTDGKQSTIVVQIPPSSLNLKRTYSMATSRDELDQDSKNYTLEDWVKPVSSPMSRRLTSKASPFFSQSPAKRTIASPVRTRPIVSKSHQGVQQYRPSIEESDSETPSPGGALAAFQQPQVIMLDDD